MAKDLINNIQSHKFTSPREVISGKKWFFYMMGLIFFLSPFILLLSGNVGLWLAAATITFLILFFIHLRSDEENHFLCAAFHMRVYHIGMVFSVLVGIFLMFVLVTLLMPSYTPIDHPLTNVTDYYQTNKIFPQN
ncbi:hypothetical protein HYV86_05500 [Candidatus Woesearchaeota archaeon]|nr:hypothetical protein [Candidatus Woesearchaeota archaeon]